MYCCNMFIVLRLINQTYLVELQKMFLNIAFV